MSVILNKQTYNQPAKNFYKQNANYVQYSKTLHVRPKFFKVSQQNEIKYIIYILIRIYHNYQ